MSASIPSSTNIVQLFGSPGMSKIYVPDYQRAYSWDTDMSGKEDLQVNTFLSDLQSSMGQMYYIGHFLFEETAPGEYAVIDGQQRLTTVIIFLSALYKKLGLLSPQGVPNPQYIDLLLGYYPIIKHRNPNADDTRVFFTVNYDDDFFDDYVVRQNGSSSIPVDTVSKKRIAAAFDYFVQEFTKMAADPKMGVPYLMGLHSALINARCTTHVVADPTQAVQMFIFQNNRGKKPTNLEIIKAQLMYHVHQYNQGVGQAQLLKDMNTRFEHIYKNIAELGDYINEDNVLNYAINIYRNTLEDKVAIEFIHEQLDKPDAKNNYRFPFIDDFTKQLESCFSAVATFMKDESTVSAQNAKYHFALHSLKVSAYPPIMFPIVIKAINSGMTHADMTLLADALDRIFLRHRIIRTKAQLETRLNAAFKVLGANPSQMIAEINALKTNTQVNYYWNNQAVQTALQDPMNPNIAKIVLWKYENYLRGKAGYPPIRYDNTSIKDPELEHIAPKHPNKSPNSGYSTSLTQLDIESLGNQLLIPGSQNSSLGNGPLVQKNASYKGSPLLHQREAAVVAQNAKSPSGTSPYWGQTEIANRKAVLDQAIVNCMI